MHHIGSGRLAGLSLLAFLAACSGGGGKDGASASIALSSQSLAFTAQALDANAPAAQSFTATFGADVVHLAVVHTGTAIAGVSQSRAGNTAQITVRPNAPADIGGGRFNGAIAVTGYVCADATCTALAAGETKTLTVSYDVSPVLRLIAPRVAVAGTSASAVIRGAGFNGFAVRGVTFGGIPATSFTLVSDSELRATYPALPAGNYAVQIELTDHQGTVGSTASLVAMDPVDRAAATLAHPAAVTTVASLVFDAERSALLLATDAGGGSISRYSYAGGSWSAPETRALANVQDVALSIDGGTLVAVSRTQVTPFDAATLTAGTAVNPPTLVANSFLKSIAMTNSNRAVITSGIAQSANTAVYAFDIGASAIGQAATVLNNATPGVSANGSLVAFVQGDPSVTADPAVYKYTATDDQFTLAGIALKQNGIAPILNRDATRYIFNGTRVYNAEFALLGTLPATTLAVALRPDGLRAYTYDSAAGGVLTFDLSATAGGNAYSAIGSALALPGDPGPGVRMTISPDGRTLFLAGATQIVVQPAPLQ